jgi:solute:Na+ symporter, SSS family
LWPWLMVALAALVIAPVGTEGATLGPQMGALVASDREMAYPALMLTLLPPGVLGLLIVSLLAAFMSTVDTHFNWGASYVVSDLALRVRPSLSPRAQIRVARAALLGFSVAAVLVAFQIERIEQAWRWVAVLGAALGVPTALRWLWWRVTAAAELAGAVVGLLVAVGLIVADALMYEQQLVVISAASAFAMLAAIVLGPRPDLRVVTRFMRAVRPLGWWPAHPDAHRVEPIWPALLRWFLLVVVLLGVLRTGVWLMIG